MRLPVTGAISLVPELPPASVPLLVAPRREAEGNEDGGAGIRPRRDGAMASSSPPPLMWPGIEDARYLPSSPYRSAANVRRPLKIRRQNGMERSGIASRVQGLVAVEGDSGRLSLPDLGIPSETMRSNLFFHSSSLANACTCLSYGDITQDLLLYHTCIGVEIPGGNEQHSCFSAETATSMN